MAFWRITSLWDPFIIIHLYSCCKQHMNLIASHAFGLVLKNPEQNRINILWSYIPIHQLFHSFFIWYQRLVLVICQRGPSLTINTPNHVSDFRPVILQLLRFTFRLCWIFSACEDKSNYPPFVYITQVYWFLLFQREKKYIQKCLE